ncbi:hypothetical protein [Sphingomonas sp. LaA6.9]|uniref:hypothetical protein n=1 Tax=Sphingomonas sp. LaA6.9 TaxID=2919914 RepID=UPI001F4FACAC|nr:hypothetical protein [Sphingomonas sp. LaA6.9]MCJ8158103.1 hypothetical protein [Sphingomonas sp. LaA6.9]
MLGSGWKAATLGIGAAMLVGSAGSADARRHYHGHHYGRPYYPRSYYRYYPPPYYYDYDRYYYPRPHPYYYYGPRCATRWVYDPYIDRRVRVRYCR